MCRYDLCPHTRTTGHKVREKNTQIPNRTIDACIITFLTKIAPFVHFLNATDAQIKVDEF